MTEFADGDILEFLQTEHADDVPIGTSNLLVVRLSESSELLMQVTADPVLLVRANELLIRVESSVEQITDEWHRRRVARLRSRLLVITSCVVLVGIGFWLWYGMFPPELIDLSSSQNPDMTPHHATTAENREVKTTVDATLRSSVDDVNLLNTQSRRDQDDSQTPATGTTADATVGDEKIETPDSNPLVADEEPAHPVLIEETRDGHAFRSEVLASLDADDPAEVCRRITTLPNFDDVGLLESTDDDHLFQSVNAFIDSVMTEHPAVRESMVERFESIGELRFQEAASESDVETVRRITMQFMGTSAERLAHQWLGDRALVEGDVATARQHFRSVLSGRSRVSRELRNQVEARLRLVDALAGSTTTKPTNDLEESEVFGLSREDFAEMLAEFGAGDSPNLQAHQRPNGLPVLAGMQVPPTPEQSPPASDEGLPRRIELKRVGEIDVANVPVSVVRGGGETRDWNGRELGMYVSGDRLVYANKTGVGTLELGNANARPRHTVVGESRGIKPDLTGVAFWPVVRGDLLFVKSVPLGPPGLAAVSKESGKVVWETDRPVASNPFLIGDQLYVVTCLPIEVAPADRTQPFTKRKPIRWVRKPRKKSVGQILQVNLESIDPQSGRAIATQPLFKIEDKWNQILDCQVSLVGESIILSLGGAVCCVEPGGPLKWIRMQPWVEQPSVVAVHDRPLVSGDDVIVFQRHAKSIDCIRSRDGHLRWSAETKGVERLIGVIDNHVLIQSTTELRAIDQTDGQLQWELPIIHLTEFFATSNNYLVVAFLERLSDERWRPVVAWIDVKTGEPAAEQILTEWTTNNGRAPLPCVGPVVADGEGKRVLVGYSPDELHRHRVREIWQLSLDSAALPKIPEDSPLRKLKIRQFPKTD